MTVVWHYSREGKKHGPVSSAELQGLARKGLLSPEDLVWKEGMENWQKAGRLIGLFPAAPAAPPPAPPKDTSSTAANVKYGASALGAYAKVAGELAVKQAEKTKIQTLSLPQAYASFGKAVYEQGTQHRDTATLFAAISHLRQQLAAVQSGKPSSADNATLGQRAANVGKQASALVSAQQLESKLYQQHSRLGELTTQRADLPNHHNAANKHIRELQERVRELGQQISALKEKVGAHGEQMQQMAKATAKRGYSLLLTAATVVTFPIAPLSWLPIWKHPGWGTFRKVTLTIMSLACTIGLVAFVIVKKAAADKAVASANAEWGKENQEEAIAQYRSLLPNSGFLGKEEQSRVYRRLIEFDVGHDNKQSARQLIQKADDRTLELNLTEPQAIEMLADYQQENRDEEERREHKRKATTVKAPKALAISLEQECEDQGRQAGQQMREYCLRQGYNSTALARHRDMLIDQLTEARIKYARLQDQASVLEERFTVGLVKGFDEGVR